MPNSWVGHKPENLSLGAILTTLSFLCISLMNVLAKEAGQYTSTGVMVFFQNLICLLFVAPVAFRGGWASLRTEKIGIHLLRAATGTAAWYALFFAIMLMPLTNAVLLAYSAPLWMPLIAWAVFRQQASVATWLGAALGFIGVLLVLQPEQNQFNMGALIALAAALFLAVALMSVRALAATEPVSRFLFYYFFLSTVMVSPIAWLQWKPVVAIAWVYFIAIGLALLLAQVFILLAYRYASAVKLGPFIYSVIVFTALIDWAVWHRVPTLFEFLGIALVIGGGLVAVRGKS